MKNRIKEYRTSIGMSQTELGKRLNVSGGTISSWEVNRTEPTMEQVVQMTKIFGCKIEDLFSTNIDFDYSIDLPSGERILVEAFRKTTDVNREIVMKLLGIDNDEDRKW